MALTAQITAIAQWVGYFTLFCAVLMILGLLLKWGIRFRLVGVTSFMAVLTGGLYALSLGFYIRPSIPDAAPFARVFDNGGPNVVIAISPDLTRTEIEATLRQAAADLYSSGRLAQGADKMTIRVRTILHPEPGVSVPLYLGEVRRSLASRYDDQMEIDLDSAKLAQLPKATAS
jgi:hypothetical protein